ncbi:MAG: hypothetical protein HC914_20305 [Chloroflexaceae bacterium]|nr:hypothetical protein [Chloroflexaceae bacterium]
MERLIYGGFVESGAMVAVVSGIIDAYRQAAPPVPGSVPNKTPDVVPQFQATLGAQVLAAVPATTRRFGQDWVSDVMILIALVALVLQYTT